MDSALLQYGAVGVLASCAVFVSGILWRRNLELHEQISGMVKRYESLIIKITEKETRLENTLESLQEGLAAKDLLAAYIEKVSNEERRNLR